MSKTKINKAEDDDFVKKVIKLNLKTSHPVYVVCNDVKKILAIAQEVANEEKTHEVWHQTNNHYYGELEITELSSAEFYEAKFKAYCNYFDKYRESQLLTGVKKFYNYSHGNEQLSFFDYPSDKNIILVIENFNFYDFNSQVILAELSETRKNLVVIGQIRDDFEFAKNHIDVGIKTGKGFGIFLEMA